MARLTKEAVNLIVFWAAVRSLAVNTKMRLKRRSLFIIYYVLPTTVHCRNVMSTSMPQPTTRRRVFVLCAIATRRRVFCWGIITPSEKGGTPCFAQRAVFTRWNASVPKFRRLNPKSVASYKCVFQVTVRCKNITRYVQEHSPNPCVDAFLL
jgi:hypothetical protein